MQNARTGTFPIDRRIETSLENFSARQIGKVNIFYLYLQNFRDIVSIPAAVSCNFNLLLCEIFSKLPHREKTRANKNISPYAFIPQSGIPGKSVEITSGRHSRFRFRHYAMHSPNLRSRSVPPTRFLSKPIHPPSLPPPIALDSHGTYLPRFPRGLRPALFLEIDAKLTPKTVLPST